LFQGPGLIISNREVMPGVHHLWVDAPEIAAVARPGQFVMLRCGGTQDLLLRRPVSISGTTGNTISFLIAALGVGTQRLTERHSAERIDLLGPMGKGFSIDSQSNRLLLVAGGMGIAPLLFLAQEAGKQDRWVRLLAGARTSSSLCPPALLGRGVECVSVTEDGTVGQKGLVTDFLAEHFEWADQAFACGPAPMYVSMSRQPYTGSQRIPPQVSLEVRMGCGLGICNSCTIMTKKGQKQVCKDGPVFDLPDILWEELKI
jgi:dihydroorotate dehydrogenase electron transfer subunit